MITKTTTKERNQFILQTRDTDNPNLPRSYSEESSGGTLGFKVKRSAAYLEIGASSQLLLPTTTQSGISSVATVYSSNVFTQLTRASKLHWCQTMMTCSHKRSSRLIQHKKHTVIQQEKLLTDQ